MSSRVDGTNRWVRAETPEDVFFRELGSACSGLRQAFARHVNRSPHQVQILVRLRRDGETSLSNLRQVLGIDGASLTRLVKQLETQGLLGRRLDPTDNRYTLAALTPVGEQTAADLERAHEQYQQRLLDGITTQQRQIVLDVLQRIRANTTELENS